MLLKKSRSQIYRGFRLFLYIKVEDVSEGWQYSYLFCPFCNEYDHYFHFILSFIPPWFYLTVSSTNHDL